MCFLINVFFSYNKTAWKPALKSVAAGGRRVSDNTSGKIIAKTRSLCPECGKVTDAVISERDNRIYITKNCVEHGSSEALLSADAGFFMRCREESIGAPVGMDCDITGCLTCTRHVDKAKTIMIDATEKCNLKCPACFTNTHTTAKRDPSIEEITSRLKEWKTRPAVLLCGGEPTVRPDLPELIAAITSLGFVVKMATNGIRLTDREFVAKLKKSGLDWALFQFDGFSDEIYEKTRGRALMEIKETALENLREAGIKVCLAMMVVKGLNDGELGRVIDYMMRSDNVMHLGCTALSCVGRDEFEAEYETSAADILRAIESGTAGRLKSDDFMHTRRIGNMMFRLTKNSEYQQKPCFHMALLHKRGTGFVPVNRYFSPGGLLRNPGGFVEMARLYGSLRNWDAMQLTGKVKLLTIEEFRARNTIDLCDANRCNKVYMAEHGYIPPCIYNTKYRPECWLPEVIQ